ncbi:transposase family tnp2 domain-containing protein [Rhizoctonia solani AG-1 IA]|uniref:Transposase family tnp2 domain-containing protein n=1 Tax=Thanatephorus cucumeris (strain AG1-IA) TaxID=983506 RepID=L8X0K7_THACA|nr:transposase family tnp2 domain-containing protein [Rhizoctonia solani AG-1 IA]
MTALRRQAPQHGRDPDASPTIQSPSPDRATSGLPSVTPNPTPVSIANETVLNVLQAATAPYCLGDLPADPGRSLDLDEIMASVGLGNTSNNCAYTPLPPDNLFDDITLPQLPPLLYGVELLPEEPALDNKSNASPMLSPQSEYSDLADVLDLAGKFEEAGSDADSANTGQTILAKQELPRVGSEAPFELPHIPLDLPQPDNSTLPPPPHIRFYESLALDLHRAFGLTRAGVEYMLKSIDWSLGDTGVVEPRSKGVQGSTSPGLSKTLPALLKRAQIESFGDKYAVCPNVDCSHLVLALTLPCATQSYCKGCSSSLTKLRRQRIGAPPRYDPKLTYTHHSLIVQLVRLLSRPEIIAAIRNHKAHLSRPGRDWDLKEDIQDGRVWSGMKGPDGKSFFTPDGDEIGLILALNCIDCRWNPENIILIGTIPGPVETKTDQLANFLDPLIDELLILWNNPETVLPTAPGKHVCLIKAALVICICDAPAAQKLSGTQGVTGTYFCTRCWCHKDELGNMEKEHDARTTTKHCKAAVTYSTLQTEAKCTEFMKTRTYFGAAGGYCHTALLWLPYWNGPRMVVVDPMHCMFLGSFLGVVKWQLQKIWVKFQHMREGDGFEIDMLHNIVQSAQLPNFLGRPPPHTGTKQGGSLTADQLRTLISVIFPIAIPVIWDSIDKESANQQALEEYWCQKAEHACLVAEREAIKKATGANTLTLPPLPDAPRAPCCPRKAKKREVIRANQPVYPDNQYLQQCVNY